MGSAAGPVTGLSQRPTAKPSRSRYESLVVASVKAPREGEVIAEDPVSRISLPAPWCMSSCAD